MKKLAIIVASIVCMKAIDRPVRKRPPMQVTNNYYIKSGCKGGCGGHCHGH